MSSLIGNLYLLLAVAGLGLGVVWWNTKSRKFGLAAAAMLALLACLWVADLFIDTNDKQIERKLQNMATAVKVHDVDGILAHISDDFHVQATDKSALRGKLQDIIRNRNVTEIMIWNYKVEDVSPEKRAANVSFDVKVHGNWNEGLGHYRCEAQFRLDPDNQWRLAEFKIFNPLVESSQPITIPGF